MIEKFKNRAGQVQKKLVKTRYFEAKNRFAEHAYITIPEFYERISRYRTESDPYEIGREYDTIYYYSKHKIHIQSEIAPA